MAPKFIKPTQTVGAPSTYSLTLKYEVDAMYAGWAFEFLNQGAVNANTRCGVFYDNLVAVSGGQLPSPHGASFFIERPAVAGAITNNKYGLWTLTRTYTAGIAQVDYTVGNYNDALVNCGWKRDESNTAFTLFKATVRATGRSLGRSLRGQVIYTTRETTIDIAVQFNTAVSATKGGLYVNSELVLLSEVTKQVFDPISKQAYLLLFTSSQGPYQLEPTGFACASSSACSGGWDTTTPTVSFSALLSDAAISAKTPQGQTPISHNGLLKLDSSIPLTDNSTTTRAECFSPGLSGSGIPNYNTQTPTAFTECRQYWFIQLNGRNDCGNIFAQTPETRNLNGRWTASFNIKCHSSYTGSCTIQSPIASTTTISFDTNSDNYCPQIVDTVTSSAVLNVYDDAGFSNAQTQFVFGTNSYFKATVTSSIKIEAVYTEEISITLGAKAPNVAALAQINPTNNYASVSGEDRQIIYTNPFNTAISAANSPAYYDEYFSGREVLASGSSTTCTGRAGINTKFSNWQSGAGSPLADGNGLLTTKCYAAGSADILNFAVTQLSLTGQASLQQITADNFFQFYWNDAVSGATGDFALPTQITWKGRIRYANQATKLVEAKWVPQARLSATTEAATASVTSTISGAPASSTEGSSAAISTTTIAVAAAAVAAIAVMAIAAFVVLRSRNAKMETETNLESVTLGTMGSSAQLSA